MITIIIPLLLGLQDSFATSFKDEMPSSITWKDIEFNAKKNQCEKDSKRPCKDFPGLPNFKNENLEKMIVAFPTLSTQPVLTKDEFIKTLHETPPQAISEPVRDSVKSIFDKIQGCLMGDKAPFIQLFPASNIVFPAGAPYSNEIFFNPIFFYEAIPRLKLSEKEGTALIYLVLAHEFSHFILDRFAREAKDHRSTSGNRRADEIMKDLMAGKKGDFMEEYEQMHFEVDRLAQQLLKRCNLPSPSYESLMALFDNYEFADPSQCTPSRKRAEVLLRGLKGL